MNEIGHNATKATGEGGRPRQLLRMSEVARELGISRSTAYLWASSGRLPVIHRGGRMYIPRQALVALSRAEAELALESLDSERG